jgi:hypothetical protein
MAITFHMVHNRNQVCDLPIITRMDQLAVISCLSNSWHCQLVSAATKLIHIRSLN